MLLWLTGNRHQGRWRLLTKGIVVVVVAVCSRFFLWNGSIKGRFFLWNAPRIRSASVIPALIGIHLGGGSCARSELARWAECETLSWSKARLVHRSRLESIRYNPKHEFIHGDCHEICKLNIINNGHGLSHVGTLQTKTKRRRIPEREETS